jgi:hypothetical protein
MNPLEYGKLIEQIGNKYIVQIYTNNVFIIHQYDDKNFIKLFRKGELMFEYIDVKKSDRSFIRTISDLRYTFENNKLISTEILNASGNVFIYPLYEDTNSIKLNPLNIDSIFN